MQKNKVLTIDAGRVNHIFNAGYASIYGAYNNPSINKIRAFNYWREYLNERGFYQIVIYGFNCNYFTLYARKNDTLLKITYANIYEYKIINQ